MGRNKVATMHISGFTVPFDLGKAFIDKLDKEHTAQKDWFVEQMEKYVEER